MDRPRVDLIYVDSGGGHRAAANALARVMEDGGLGWDVRLVSVQDLLAPIDFVRKATGIPAQEIYNILLRHGWTAGSAWMIRLMHRIIRASHSSQVQVLAKYWAERKPDLIVSLIPHFNRAMKESLDCARPGAPFVTILTDIADYPPHFWIEPQDQFVICGSERAVLQAHQIGVPRQKVLRVSGMILHPRFYEPVRMERTRERARLGLQAELPVGLVVFGGEGSSEMIEVARALNRPDSGCQLLFLCGKNEEVRWAIEAMPRHVPRRVEGFTRDVPFYMELADFFIGKPGPGSLSEAIAKRLPVIVRCHRKTLAHERYNCRWLKEREAGVVIGSYAKLWDAVQELLRPERYLEIRDRLSALPNRAVFEIPELLERILRESRYSPAQERTLVH